MRKPNRMLSHLVVLMCLGAMAGCAYPVRNQPLHQPIVENDGYRGQQIRQGELPNTLIVMTISGGGTRASALGFGAMQALRNIRLGGDGPTLLEEVDIVSSVSGGSVPAAYLALKGPRHIGGFRNDFLVQDGIMALAWNGLNPVGFAELATPAVQRIDLLIDYFDESLFEGATYADLRDRDHRQDWRRPFLIVNAADMVAGAPFPFHQYQFDLLCSDLEQVPLSVAVAASAAFPVALSPVTLHNYSEEGGCAAFQDSTYPPAWTSQVDEPSSIYDNSEWVQWARRGATYLETEDGVPSRQYVHLLDGGIVDNLGLREPMRMMMPNEAAAGDSPFLDVLDGINEVLIVIVNARSDPQSRLDRQIAPPNEGEMVAASINSAVDNATLATLRSAPGLIDALQVSIQKTCASNADASCDLTSRIALIDFDHISNPSCRVMFKDIVTSWTLSEDEVDALIDMAGALLWKSTDFRRFVGSEVGGGTMTAPILSDAEITEAETRACGRLALALSRER